MARQFSRYFFVAGFCATLNIAILLAGEAAGLHYAVSTIVSFVTCVLVGYALHSRWTFRAEQRFEDLVRYALAMSTNVPLSLVTLWGLYTVARLPMTIAAPASTAVTMVANFGLSRWAILRSQRSSG